MISDVGEAVGIAVGEEQESAAPGEGQDARPVDGLVAILDLQAVSR